MLLVTVLLPGFLKKAIYRYGFGYHIGRNVRLGVVFLDCDELTIGDDTVIRHGTVFWRCGKVKMGKHVAIGWLNLFRGGESIVLDDYAQIIRLNVFNAIPDHDCINQPVSAFHLGFGSVVTAEHRIDFTDRVSIGKCSIFGGRNSTIWTHNRRRGIPVAIGDYCCVGSESRMAPGAAIPDCCMVGLGSVVTNSTHLPHSLLAGVPAKIRRPLQAKDYEILFAKTRPEIPDEEYPFPVAAESKRPS
jgi:carbonic anhydrase/acetyltransferase-like protein (isoleucine patch superfamily)